MDTLQKAWFHFSWRHSVAIKLLSLTEVVSGCSSKCPCFRSICLPAHITTTIIIIIGSLYSLCSIGHLWRASRHCGLQLSLWTRSLILLCFLSHPLLFFATFSSAYLSFYIPEDSSLMHFSLLLLFLYIMCVESNSISSLYLIFYWLLMGDSP